MRRAVRHATTLSAVLLATSVAALTTGCGSSDPVSPQRQLPGTYTLRSINGQTLPVLYGSDSTGSYTLTSDVYTFTSDGKFTEQYGLQQTTPSGASTTMPFSDAGTWTLSGTAVVISYPAYGTQMTGAFSGGNTITFANGTTTEIFSK